MKTKAILIFFALSLLLSGCKGEKIHISDSEEPFDPGERLPVSGEESDVHTFPYIPENTKDPEILEKPPATPEAAASEPAEVSVVAALAPADDNQIAATARSLTGTPFVDGGSSPSVGFDNSGFIQYVLRENGYVNCPRGIYEQSVMGNKVDTLEALLPGDLVYFSDTGEKAQYGGIYVGDNVMVSCRMPGETVREFDITANYYMQSFFTGVRVF